MTKFIAFYGRPRGLARWFFGRWSHCAVFWFHAGMGRWLYCDPCANRLDVYSWEFDRMVRRIRAIEQSGGRILAVRGDGPLHVVKAYPLGCASFCARQSGIKSKALRPMALFRDLLRSGKAMVHFNGAR